MQSLLIWNRSLFAFESDHVLEAEQISTTTTSTSPHSTGTRFLHSNRWAVANAYQDRDHYLSDR